MNQPTNTPTITNQDILTEIRLLATKVSGIQDQLHELPVIRERQDKLETAFHAMQGQLGKLTGSVDSLRDRQDDFAETLTGMQDRQDSFAEQLNDFAKLQDTFTKRQDHFENVLTTMRDRQDTLVEAVGSMHDYMRTLAKQSDLEDVKAGVQIIKYAVTDTSRKLHEHLSNRHIHSIRTARSTA